MGVSEADALTSPRTSTLRFEQGGLNGRRLVHKSEALMRNLVGSRSPSPDEERERQPDWRLRKCSMRGWSITAYEPAVAAFTVGLWSGQ